MAPPVTAPKGNQKKTHCQQSAVRALTLPMWLSADGRVGQSSRDRSLLLSPPNMGRWCEGGTGVRFGARYRAAWRGPA